MYGIAADTAKQKIVAIVARQVVSAILPVELIVAGAAFVVLLVWPLVAPGRRPAEETTP